MHRGLVRSFPSLAVVERPMADGGPGTLDVLSSTLDLDTHQAAVSDALGRPITARWGSLGSDTAIVETAEAVGLSLLSVSERDPRSSTSRGAGELISAALDWGAVRIFVTLGGSATNDGGRGFLEALGARFEEGRADIRDLDSRLSQIELIALTDVDNTLLGPNGATMVYASQKGAADGALDALEQRMAGFADTAEEAFATRVRDTAGAGAAGGLGFALLLLGAPVLSGAEVVSRLIGLPELLKESDAVLTGEGAFDAQTARGKGVGYLLELARRLHVPAYGIFGQMRDSALSFEEIISLQEQAGSIETAMANAEVELERAAFLIGEMLRIR
jgi:glycerate kinase